jgi:class 3 adenylate cyclase
MTSAIRLGFRLRDKLLMSVTVLVILLISAILFILNGRLQASTKETLDNDLAKTRAVFNHLQTEQGKALMAKAVLIADAPHLKAAIDVAKPNMATTTDQCIGLKKTAQEPLFLVTDKHGKLLFDSFNNEAIQAFEQGREADPKKMATLTSPDTWPNVQQALQGQRVGGVFIHPFMDKNGKETKVALQTVTVPILLGGDVLGTVILGAPLDDALAGELKEMTDSQIAIFLGRKVFASTWPEDKRPMVETSLAGILDEAQKSSKESTLRNSIPMGQEEYSYIYSPLKDSRDQVIGDYVILRSENDALQFQRTLQTSIMIVGISGIIIAIIMAVFIARRITEPLNSLLLGVQEVAKGNLNAQVPIQSKDELGLLAASFNEMIQGLREKERVTNILGKYISPEVAKKVLGDREGVALKGERRECVVMFTDIRGFTAMSENAPPEKVVADLNEYFTLMVDTVIKYEGTLDKFIGDAIMAVWGAPVPFEDKELRGVKAALEMQEALGKYNKERIDRKLNPLTMGIGLNSGVVVSGNLGSDKRTDYTVIGEEVNLASRLCSKAVPGQTLISESMYRKLKGLVEVKALEPIALKGFTDPVKVYEVTGLTKT